MNKNTKMQTVIRLKRPLEDSPSDTLILNCSKKQKLENADGGTGSLSTILKFSATQESQDYDINEHVANIKNGIKGGIKEIILQKYKRNVDLNKKLCEEAKNHSKNDRYKVVNCLRSIANDDSNSLVTVLNIEKEDEAGKSESNQNYVYDLYYTDAKILGEADTLPLRIDDYEISIHPSTATFDSDDVYDDSDQESDDSNAENYYKNEYPEDESDRDSITEDDIIENMKKCDLNDLSTTDEEEHAYCSDEIDDDSEENLYGNSYRKFKPKYNDELSSDESENNYDEYD